MTLTYLAASDLHATPWKNGGGTTMELVVRPLGATVGGDFLWRISIATIAVPGEFSCFPGYDRTIVQLDGQPMRLIHANQPGLAAGEQPSEAVLSLMTPYHFSGDWPTYGQIYGPLVRDFNVIVRRGFSTADVRCLTLDPATPILLPASDALLIYAHGGPVNVTSVAGEQRIAQDDALLFEGETSGVTLTRPASTSGILVVLCVLLKASRRQHSQV